MGIEQELANMSDPFLPKRWNECAFRGCADWVAPGRVYCRRHAPQVEAKLCEIEERRLQGPLMPPVPVVVDVEEAQAVPVYRRTLSADYDPCHDADAWDAVGLAETVCLLCAAMFSLAVWGAAWLRDTRLAVFAALCALACVFAPAFLRWVQRICHQVAEAFAWGLGE